MRKDLFALDGRWCSEFDIILQGPVTFTARRPRVSTISIPGRNGDLHIYDGSFDNVKGNVGCFILKELAHEKLSLADQWLFGKQGYRRLEVSGEPGYFRFARIVNGAEEAIRMHLLAPFNLEFDCDPRKFMVSGEQKRTVTNGGILQNPGLTAKPLIEITGDGAGTFTIGNVTVTISDMEAALTLDCETENAYKGLENQNGNISALKFPVLEPGNNLIAWTGGITGVKITPRWWT